MTNVSQRMLNLGTARSEIREAFAFAQARAAEVGAENVDDCSIGNPSVPAPATVAEAVHKLVDDIDSSGECQLRGFCDGVRCRCIYRIRCVLPGNG